MHGYATMSQPADDPVTIGPPPSPSPVPCFSDPMIAEADGGLRPSSLYCDLLGAAWLPQRPTAGPAGARWDPMLLEAPACPLESIVADVASPFLPAAVNEQAQVALEYVRFSLSPSEPVRDTIHDHVLGDSTLPAVISQWREERVMRCLSTWFLIFRPMLMMRSLFLPTMSVGRPPGRSWSPRLQEEVPGSNLRTS